MPLRYTRTKFSRLTSLSSQKSSSETKSDCDSLDQTKHSAVSRKDRNQQKDQEQDDKQKPKSPRSLSLSAEAALSVVITTTSITRELADVCQFPPVRAAAGLVLMILKTIQDVQTNRSECYRLARRCISMLVDIKDQMEGRWEGAPISLIRNLERFERTLASIHTFMTAEAEQKWHARLLRKNTIEEAITRFHAELDDATRMFQIATLISIHYSVGNGSFGGARRDTESLPAYPERSVGSSSVSSESSVELASSPTSLTQSFSDAFSESYVEVTSEPETLDSSAELEVERAIADAVPAAMELDHRGFKRYHRSEVRLKGRTRMESGWWSGSNKAQVDRKNVLIKHYDPNGRTGRWIRDVKLLQNIYHPNLPQMIGYSDDETPTPFILLANVQMRLPEALVLDAIQNSSLQRCAQVIFRFYRDTLDAALYMQRQLNLSDTKLQDYVEHADYRIDGENTLIMGLPPPEIDRWVSFRNYGLVHSICSQYLKLLPNSGYAKQPEDSEDERDPALQRKIAHLAVLAKALFPDGEDPMSLSERLDSLLSGDDDEDSEDVDHNPLTLRQIRMIAIKANKHDHVWKPNTVLAHKFRAGDVGWVPHGKEFNEMEVFCNVLDNGMAKFDMKESAIGWQGSWVGGHRENRDMKPIVFPNDIYGWPVIIPPGTKQDLQILHETTFASFGDGWRFLLEHGKTLASNYGVKPEQLILVSRAGTDQIFGANDHRRDPFEHLYQQHSSFGRQTHGFGRSSHMQPIGHFHHRPEPPFLLFLFSSPRKDHVPTWSDSPMYEAGYELRLNHCTTNVGWLHGYLNYIQLHEDDFLE